MTSILVWIITALVILLLVTFVASVISMRSIPTRDRPFTATYNRFGEFIAMKENPDYHENPGEQDDEPPDKGDALFSQPRVG